MRVGTRKCWHTIDDREGVEDDDASCLLGGEQDPPPHRSAARRLLLPLVLDLGLLLAAAAGPVERRAPGRHEHPCPARRRCPAAAGLRDGEHQAAGGRPRRCRPSTARLQQQHPRRGREGRSHAKTARVLRSSSSSCCCYYNGVSRCSGHWYQWCSLDWRSEKVIG